MKSHQLLLLLAAGILPTQCSSDIIKESPNILFIAVDDLKPMLNCYGESQIISPNIDKLAAKGTLFLTNYCQQAICGPSRASLMTGLRPDRTQVWDLKTRMRDVNPDILTLPQFFRQNGYSTAAFGKIYDPRCVGPEYDKESWSIPYEANHELPLPEGIEAPIFAHYQKKETREKGEKLLKEADSLGMEGWDKNKYAMQFLKPVTESADVPDNAYYDGIMTEQAIIQLNKFAEAGEPFFLGVGYKKPHLPFVAPQKYWDLYDRDEIYTAKYQKQSKNGPDIAYHKSGELRSYTGFEFVDGLIPVEQQKQIIHGYYAAVSYVDALIGQVIEKLNELELEENTIIILWGDHGWHLGDHGLWCKHTNFEQATRSPMIITAPGMPHGIEVSSPTDFIDIFPTLCELSGLEIPGELDGVSLLPLIIGEANQVKEYSLSQYPRGKQIMGYTIRTERYRYTEWHKNEYRSFKKYTDQNIVARELYDYKVDPLETINFYEDPEYTSVAGELESIMKEFLISNEKSEYVE